MHSATPLFAAGRLRGFELGVADVPQLQCFFEANPEYFRAVTGQPPSPTEAEEEYEGALPDGWSFTRKWLLGVTQDDGTLVAMANVVSDLLAPSVWHIGLFIVATSRHGSGEAQSVYRSLEAWAASCGAKWFRLGVVQGNRRAERFWESLGFTQTRTRAGVQMGNRTNTLLVLAKPLAGGNIAEYLSLVERDRPSAL